MSDDSKDLVRLAAEFADKNVDLYDLLGVDALTPKEDIHRAWRKQSLKYHPDKAGANFDAEVWERFERARDVLSDPNSRAVYDQALSAKLLRKAERDAMDKERKRFADDLEAAENVAKSQRDQKAQWERDVLQKERERLSEERRMHDEELKRQEEAAQNLEDMVEAKRRMKERKEEKARKKQAKEALKGSSSGSRGGVGVGSKASGPANGAVAVPGNYFADLGTVKKMYWELVCDKLRAVQTARNLQRQDAAAEEVREAEEGVLEARRRIYEAEMKFQA